MSRRTFRQLRSRLLRRQGHSTSTPCPRPVNEELELRQHREDQQGEHREPDREEGSQA